MNDTSPIAGETEGSYQLAYTPYVGPTITGQLAETVLDDADTGSGGCCMHAFVGSWIVIDAGNYLPLQDPTAGACPPVVAARVSVGNFADVPGTQTITLDAASSQIDIYYSDAVADPCPRAIADMSEDVHLDQQLTPSGQIKLDTTSCLEPLACNATAEFAIEGLDVAGAAVLRESGTFQISWWPTGP